MNDSKLFVILDTIYLMAAPAPAAPLALFLPIEPKKMSSEQDIVAPLQQYIKQQGEFDEKAFEVPHINSNS